MTPSYSFSTASFSTSISQLGLSLLSMVNEISQWMSSNFLCLNSYKTEFITIRLSAQNYKRKFLTLQYTLPITLLPQLSSLMLLFAILVLGLLLILISLSPTTSPTSPASDLCTYVTSAASDPCLNLKLLPPSPPPSSTQN